MIQKNGTITANIFSTNGLLENMEQKYFAGAQWAKIFEHNNHAGTVLFSSLVECLHSETKDKYHFFTYDAWGHQNDLPRRSILEELTSDITQGPNALLAESTWKQRLDNLLAKRKKTIEKRAESIMKSLKIY